MRKPSEQMLERARHDPFIQQAIGILMNTERSYEDVLEGLALALSEEKERLIDTVVKQSERLPPEPFLLASMGIKVIPTLSLDDYIYLRQDPAPKPTTRDPWGFTGRDIIKDVSDWKKQMMESHDETMRKAPEPAKTVALGNCKVCGTPFNVPLRKASHPFPPPGSIRIDVAESVMKKPYDFDGTEEE